MRGNTYNVCQGVWKGVCGREGGVLGVAVGGVGGMCCPGSTGTTSFIQIKAFFTRSQGRCNIISTPFYLMADIVIHLENPINT